ncbi:MAG: taurine catabolism dioxygenase TauD [Gammaproteobacteria bacterium]|nr:taurine catabolism dioxygenase TauD [Gammaproteobacteria bacterium]
MSSVQTTKQFSEKYKLGSPFDLDNDIAYHAWLENKMDDYPQAIEDIVVEVSDTKKLSIAEFKVIRDLVKKTNMAIYAGNTGSDPDKAIPVSLANQFGLSLPDDNMGADDGITALRVAGDEWRGEYIPYTNRSIHWHTDGYYNTAEHQIQSLLLHCVTPAASGGENALLDPEIIYIRLRQENPDYIRALMEPDVMMIPANINKEGEMIRPDRYGPVFSMLPDGNLHMRYTARTRSIEWKQDPLVLAAVALLHDYLHTDSPYIYRGTLQPGQGLISNNVLHDRSGFEDDDEHKRLLYRLRYYQRVAQA